MRGRKAKPAQGIGKRWREARLAKGWASLSTAARHTGVAQQTLSNIELGLKEASGQTVQAAAKAYNVPEDFLRYDEPDLPARLIEMMRRGDFDPPLTLLEQFQLALSYQMLGGRELSRQEYLLIVELMRRPFG